MTVGTGRLDRSRYDLEFAEDFTGTQVDPRRWTPHYLPQWTTPDRSAARYDLNPGVLRLRIDADQPAWRPDDGELRVSNLQTGSFSGGVGSDRGTHRHRPDLRVATAVPTRRLYTPSSGLVEARLRATPDPTCMLAAWLGVWRRPHRTSPARSASPSCTATPSAPVARRCAWASRPTTTPGSRLT